MHDDALITYEELRSKFGITYSRTHLPRLEKAGKFPRRFKPIKTRGARFFYRLADIYAWMRGDWPRVRPCASNPASAPPAASR